MSDLQEAILNAYADIMRELIGAFISILYESKISLPIRKTYDGPFGYGKRYSMYEYENFYLKERDFERLIIMLDSLQVEKGRNWKIRIYAVDILNPYTKLPKLMYSNRNAPYPIDSPEAALLWFLSPTIEETSLDRNELQKLLNKAVKIQLEAISDQLKQVEDRSVKTPF